jgi:hypothetical protein
VYSGFSQSRIAHLSNYNHKRPPAKLSSALLALAALAFVIIALLYEFRRPPRGCTAQDMPGEYAASDALASKVIPGCPGPFPTN